MNAKLLLILPIFLLASCQNTTNESSSISGFSSGQTSSGSEKWSEEVRSAMESALGETIPFLDEFASSSYALETGFMEGSSIPYVNPYWTVNAGDNWCEKYKSLLESSNYTFGSSDADEEDPTCIWYNHSKAIEDNAINVRYAFYQTEISGSDSYIFDIYAWLENASGGLTMPEEVDFTFLPETFGTSGTSYANAVKEIDVDGVMVHASNIMNQSDLIQMRKADGKLNNLEAMRPIKYLYLEGLSVRGSIDHVVVKAGTSLSNLSVVSTFNDVYNLNGATYFEIATNNRQVVRLDSIQLLYV